MRSHFGSTAYWAARYSAGGRSGAGSYGALADYKARFVNGLIELNAVRSVADFGCGDGNLLSMLPVHDYTGLDVSATVLARCSVRFPQHKFLLFDQAANMPPADMCLSMDVIYHLVEDLVFAAYMDALFSRALGLVAIYSSNVDQEWPNPHVRHRRFSDYIAARCPDWRLRAHVPNPHPFDSARPNDTSFADFFVYARAGRDCSLLAPGA